MKRLISIFSLLLFTISLYACNSRLTLLDYETSFEKRETTKMVKAIVEAIESRDANALKKLFSANAKEKANDLDEGIKYLMEFYQGKSTDLKDELGSGTEHIEHGKSKKIITRTYIVQTEIETYRFNFAIIFSDFDKNDTGLFQLHIINESDTKQKAFWILHSDTPGVLWNKMLTPDDYVAGVTRALSNGDEEAVAAMFSKEAYDKSSNLKSEIETVTQKFRSYVDYVHFPTANILSEETTGTQTIIKAKCELPTHTFSGEKDSDYTIYFVYIQDIKNYKGGFYTVQIVRKTNESNDFKINDCAGIFYESDAPPRK